MLFFGGDYHYSGGNKSILFEEMLYFNSGISNVQFLKKIFC